MSITTTRDVDHELPFPFDLSTMELLGAIERSGYTVDRCPHCNRPIVRHEWPRNAAEKEECRDEHYAG